MQQQGCYQVPQKPDCRRNLVMVVMEQMKWERNVMSVGRDLAGTLGRYVTRHQQRACLNANCRTRAVVEVSENTSESRS